MTARRAKGFVLAVVLGIAGLGWLTSLACRSAIAPPALPATAPPEAEGPLPTALPVYEIRRVEDASFGGRTRFVARIVVPPEYDRSAMVTVLADAARAVVKDRRAQAVTVFAYTEELIGQGVFDKGKAEISSDGKGWAGDGKFDRGPDSGAISLEIGDGARAGTERLTVPR